MVDGYNPCVDKTPGATYYKPKYNYFRGKSFVPRILDKQIEMANFDAIIARKEKANEPGENIISEKLVRFFYRNHINTVASTDPDRIQRH